MASRAALQLASQVGGEGGGGEGGSSEGSNGEGGGGEGGGGGERARRTFHYQLEMTRVNPAYGPSIPWVKVYEGHRRAFTVRQLEQLEWDEETPPKGVRRTVRGCLDDVAFHVLTVGPGGTTKGQESLTVLLPHAPQPSAASKAALSLPLDTRSSLDVDDMLRIDERATGIDAPTLWEEIEGTLAAQLPCVSEVFRRYSIAGSDPSALRNPHSLTRLQFRGFVASLDLDSDGLALSVPMVDIIFVRCQRSGAGRDEARKAAARQTGAPLVGEKELGLRQFVGGLFRMAQQIFATSEAHLPARIARLLLQYLRPLQKLLGAPSPLDHFLSGRAAKAVLEEYRPRLDELFLHYAGRDKKTKYARQTLATINLPEWLTMCTELSLLAEGKDGKGDGKDGGAAGEPTAQTLLKEQAAAAAGTDPNTALSRREAIRIFVEANLDDLEAWQGDSTDLASELVLDEFMACLGQLFEFCPPDRAASEPHAPLSELLDDFLEEVVFRFHTRQDALHRRHAQTTSHKTRRPTSAQPNLAAAAAAAAAASAQKGTPPPPPPPAPGDLKPKSSIIAVGNDGPAWRAVTRRGSGRPIAAELATRPHAPRFPLTEGMCGRIMQAVLPPDGYDEGQAQVEDAARRASTVADIPRGERRSLKKP